jgi:hypothetical protein
MRYRKIPFMSAKGSALMDGLAPVTTQKGFGPQFPNSSMLGATPAGTTVIMRPQPGTAAGFPGFFGWLRATQPGLYNYTKAALPAYVTQAEAHRTGGATLSGLGLTTRPPVAKPKRKWAGFYGEETASDSNGIQNSLTMPSSYLGAFSASGLYGEEDAVNDNGIANGLDPLFSRPKYKPAFMDRNGVGMYMAGLGDDGDDSVSDTSSIDSTDLTSISPQIISTPIPTVNIPDTTAETSSVGTPPTPSAGAVQAIVSTLTAAAPAVLSDINSQTIFNAQLARAQAGLPPLNTAAYGIGTTLSSLASSPLLLLGIGGIALLLFMGGKK